MTDNDGKIPVHVDETIDLNQMKVFLEVSYMEKNCSPSKAPVVTYYDVYNNMMH